MFGTQTRFIAVVAVAALCVVSTFAEEDIIYAQFTETRSGKPELENATFSGELYYYYDNTTTLNSRLYIEYTIPGTGKIKNLYHFQDGAIYSICTSTCTGLLTSFKPDPWYYDSWEYVRGYQEGSLYWYVPRLGSNHHIKQILMDENGMGQNTISKIMFNNNSTITIKAGTLKHKPAGITKSSSIFQVPSNLNCPKAVCPIYADMVFVLDNSGSVIDSEWKQTTNFVNAVMDSFAFGVDAVEAAIIQFNAQATDGFCSHKYVDGCQLCTADYPFKSGYSFPGYATASIVAGKDYGSGLTVSVDKAALKSTINGKRPDRNGNTCQGYGLELAMTMLDRSPRKNYAKKPNKIVISVTDGIDMCPNRTADAAAKLKNTYGAFLIEIGVGMPTSCNNYYKKYLQHIASKIGSSTDPAYYDVNYYSSIKDVTEKLFKPICGNFATDCGPECLGICGCGKCFCPECKQSGSSCFSIGCRADSAGKSSTGCVVTNNPCPKKDDICTTYVCDGSKQGDARCSGISNPCTALSNKNKGTCRTVYCSVAEGGCRVKLDHNFCQKKHGNKCLEYECTPENLTAEIAETGCRLKLNRTKEHEKTLMSNGKIKCFSATCDGSTGALGEKDICVPSNKNCYDSTCTLVSGVYQCVEKDNSKRPANTSCANYTCKASGWDVYQQKTEKDCINELGGAEKNKCNLVSCDANKGCVFEPINGCEGNCTPEKIKSCAEEGATSQYSTVTHCVLGSCYVKDDPVSGYVLDCDFKKNYKDCTVTMADEVATKNKQNPDKCYNPVCGSDGRCNVTFTTAPDSMPITKCMKPICSPQGNGLWKWEYVPTDVNSACKSDACTFRECRNDADADKFPDGCYWQDICEFNTTECSRFECVREQGSSPICKEYVTKLNESECMKQICNSTNQIEWVFKDLQTSCNFTNKCVVPECNEANRSCAYPPKKPEASDPCIIYTCNPSTGMFREDEKCDDGLHCTENICTVNGECMYEPIVCANELSMEGYPCFEARCKEDPDDENKDGKLYRCVRKLNRNAYIDVCGNCIQDKPVVLPSSSSSAASASASASISVSASNSVNSGEDSGTSSSLPTTADEQSDSSSVDLLECTGAPPRPLLTEGLAAASIALIIIFAVVIGAGIAASGVLGTKALIDRARQADNQSAHTNPLYQNNDAEMSNPAFVEAN